MKKSVWFKFVFCSLMGLVIFFVPFTVGETNSIAIDHIASFIREKLGDVVSYLVLGLILYGIVESLYSKSWKKDITSKVMLFFKVLGFVCASAYIWKFGPSVIHNPGNLPFLFDKLAVSLSIVIPVGGMLLCLITGYGFMEFIGVFARPLMRPIFKTPGNSAIDAVASFVGSYSIGLLITDDQYKTGKYTKKEAAVIATGFSTVSATFMVVVAKTLGLMDIWNVYFITTLVITFIVTAITIRFYPLRGMENVYVDGSEMVDDKPIGGLLKTAIAEGLNASENSKPIATNLLTSLVSALKVSGSVVATVLSIGLVGLLVGEYTPLFDILGYLFYPFTFILGYSEPMLMAKASSISIAEMFLPALLVTDADMTMRFAVGVISVSEILFLSASIPCILSTQIPIKFKDILIIWFIRVVLSLIIVTPIAHFLG